MNPLTKVLSILCLLLTLTGAFTLYLYKDTKNDLKALESKYTQLQVAYDEQSVELKGLISHRQVEVKVETQYVEKLVDTCKKEKEIINGIQKIPKKDTSNEIKSDVVDPDGKLGDDFTRLLHQAYLKN